MPNASTKKARSKPKASPDQAAVAETSKSLHQIAAALGYIVLQGSTLKDAKNPDKIRFLSKFGFDRYQMAAILDSTPNTVSKELSILRVSREREEPTLP